MVQFEKKVEEHSRMIANKLSPNNFGIANKLFHHLILTQKMVLLDRNLEF